VLIDNAAGAQLAVRHMITHGHRRVALVGDSASLYTARERLRGYTNALAAAEIPLDETLISMEHSTSESARQAMLELLALPKKFRPTAILTANNRCTVGALHAGDLRKAGIALVGFDEFELADLLGITVVRTDPYRMGQVAAELALGPSGDAPRPAEDEQRPAQRIVLPVELVVRGSGEVTA